MGRSLLSIVLTVALSVSSWTAVSVQAQSERTVVASGLNSPRGLAFGPNGELYVTEAGTGGEERVNWTPPFGFGMIGNSGRVLRVDGGQTQVIASGLQSQSLGPGNETIGADGLAFIGSTLYAVIGQMRPGPEPSPTRALLVRVGMDGAVETVADLGEFERANDPDGAGFDSNPFDITAGPDGNLYVADAGANAVFKVTPAGEVSVAHVWNDGPVPTAIAFDRTGQAHVSFLSRAPFVAGTARVERITANGSEIALPNQTALVDLTYGPDGSLYLLQFSSGFSTTPPPPSWTAQSGQVLRVTSSGTEVVASGLNFPTRMAFGPDGLLYVTNNSANVPAGTGEVVRLSVTAPAPSAPAAASAPAAPARQSAPPAQVPRALPRTGGLPGPELPLALAAFGLIAGGVLTRRFGR